MGALPLATARHPGSQQYPAHPVPVHRPNFSIPTSSFWRFALHPLTIPFAAAIAIAADIIYEQIS